MTRALAVAAVLATALVLAGCDDSSSSDGATVGDPASSISSAPAETSSPSGSDGVPESFGSTVNGTGYTFDVPEGWGQPSRTPPGEFDAFAVDLHDADGFSDNVNVLLSPAPSVTRQQIRAEFAAADVKVSFGDNVRISGMDSLHVMGSMSNRGVDYYIEQFYPTAGDGQVYVVTFSFSPSVTPSERTAVIDETLATWVWTI
ncbi:hypothetical protein ncot_02105 [Nocardioides sp. JQ2195]|uniref:hypothetical protein n=1 Tax=Nocardioides sp. JQ2195 TaxID=2592334 RepID=UPI00143EA8E7|nr:hypothetical protein [Nocardioides sp. JQ2195]QIX25515.1 hypothetical protein ncot_02105 [Nocardioides sp. JQ2195]